MPGCDAAAVLPEVEKAGLVNGAEGASDRRERRNFEK